MRAVLTQTAGCQGSGSQLATDRIGGLACEGSAKYNLLVTGIVWDAHASATSVTWIAQSRKHPFGTFIKRILPEGL